MASVIRGNDNFDTAAAGKVLQVVSVDYGDRYFTTSSSMTASPLTATITPTSSNSKILVSVSALMASGSGTVSMFWQVRRGSTDVVAPNTSQSLGSRIESFMVYPNGDNNVTRTNTYTILDSPSSSSAVTYTLYVKGQSGGAAILNGSYNNLNNSAYGHMASSTITLMEIGQ